MRIAAFHASFRSAKSSFCGAVIFAVQPIRLPGRLQAEVVAQERNVVVLAQKTE